MSPEPMVRDATAADLDKLVAYEIEIARISFPANPIVDPGSHRNRIAKALDDAREGTFVAGGADAVVGWTWVSIRENFLTGEHYANLRSVAVDDGPDSTAVAQALVRRAERFGAEHGVTEIVGRVHVRNVPMRVVYRSLGFEAEHLTMRKMFS
jgi:ribosomal protein S18 acetylase RimI-like enzyme